MARCLNVKLQITKKTHPRHCDWQSVWGLQDNVLPPPALSSSQQRGVSALLSFQGLS